MSVLQLLHDIVTQQKQALEAHDLDRFQQLLEARAREQLRLRETPPPATEASAALAAEILQMDRAVEGALRSLMDQTKAELDTLALGPLALRAYSQDGGQAGGGRLDETA